LSGAGVSRLENRLSSEVVYDIIIIGAGPAGLSMAAEARTAGISADKLLILEKGEAHSWSIRKFYPEKKLVEANYKGKPAVCNGVLCIPDLSKDETLTYLDRAIEQHGLEVRYREVVTAIKQRGEGGFEVRSNLASYESKVCVIAIGILGRPNKPGYKVPVKVRQRVHFDVTSREYEGQDALVVGGGDSASEYAQYLVQCGNHVTLSYRRESFDRMTSLNRESLLALEQRGKVQILRGSNVGSLSEDGGRPRVHFAEERHRDQSFDQIFYALGGSTPENFLREVGITFQGKHPDVTRGYETSIRGLYLIGDLTPESGSIILAFNTSRDAMRDICDSHLGCAVPPTRDSGARQPRP
jgi:thioredoxin reductase (NADPH)